DPRLLPATRPDAAAPGGERPEAPDGARLPVVSGAVEPVGERRGADPPARLPGVVRPGDGGVQRVGEGVGAGETREPDGGRGRSELTLRGVRRPPPAGPPAAGRGPPGRPLPPGAAAPRGAGEAIGLKARGRPSPGVGTDLAHERPR